MNIFQEIKKHVSFQDLIDKGYIDLLVTKGKIYKGQCALCQKDSPQGLPLDNFKINTEIDIFYCSVCKRGGDIFSFISALKNLSPYDSAQWIAKEFKVQVPNEYVDALHS